MAPVTERQRGPDRDSGIPRVIHQIWWQGSGVVPGKYTGNQKKWRSLNPDMSYMCWDAEKIMPTVQKNFPRLTPVFHVLPYLVQKVDLAKYVLLYLYGGIYVDMDMEPVKPLRELMENNMTAGCIVARHNTEYMMTLLCMCIGLRDSPLINNAVIACSSGNAMMKELIGVCVEACGRRLYTYLPRVISINLTTGPVIFTQVVQARKGRGDGGLVILPAHSFEPCNIFGKCSAETGEVFAIHRLDASWATGEKQLAIFLHRYGLLVLSVILLIIYISRR